MSTNRVESDDDEEEDIELKMARRESLRQFDEDAFRRRVGSHYEGYFLNPQYQYGPCDIGDDNEIMLGLKNVIMRLESDLVNQGQQGGDGDSFVLSSSSDGNDDGYDGEGGEETIGGRGATSSHIKLHLVKDKVMVLAMLMIHLQQCNAHINNLVARIVVVVIHPEQRVKALHMKNILLIQLIMNMDLGLTDKALAALAVEDKKRQYAAAETYLEDLFHSALATSD
ncbi:hypothetical protein GH714_036617 [Hevea brasiliensis]|uniref:Uncharacterized protein n=1 Tax=Hevea brasiliensis TaxID=3981 RepID=A0A6A6M3G7_HEVBR|nr:hypothetical protein GH714_036617 [Hevea brasiliensis]